MKVEKLLLIFTLVSLTILVTTCTSLGAEENLFELKDAYWTNFKLGSTSYFSIILNYRGGHAASGLEASLDPGLASTGGDYVISYGEEVKPGQQVLLTFTLTPPLKPKVPSFNAELKLKYTFRGLDREERLTIPISISGLPSLTISTDDVELKRGALTEVSLKVRNEGTGAARLISLTASPTTPYLSVVETSSIIMEPLPPLSKALVKLKLHTHTQAPQSLSLAFTTTYLDQFGNLYTKAYTIGFALEPIPPAKLSLSLEPSTIAPDEVNHVKLIVKNEDILEATSISIILTPSPGLTIMGTNYFYRDSIHPKEGVEIPLTIFASPTLYGATSILASINYRDGEGRDRSLTITLGLEVRGEVKFTALRTLTNPSPPLPGDEGLELKVFLINIGTTTAKEVKVNLVLPQGMKQSYTTSTEASLGTLKSGEYREASFYIDLVEELKPESYNLTLIVSYTGGMEKLNLTLEVMKKARFEVVEVRAEPTILKQDFRGARINLLLRNLENVEAKQVRVRMLGFMFSGSTLAFIGSVRGLTTATASFEVDVSPDAPLGEVLVELQALWTQYGRTLTQTLYAKVNIESKGFAISLRWFTEAPLQMKAAYIIIIALILLTIGPALKKRSTRKSVSP